MFYLNALFAISLYLFVMFTKSFWVKIVSTQSFLISVKWLHSHWLQWRSGRALRLLYVIKSDSVQINIHVYRWFGLIKQEAINKANLASISVAIKPIEFEF